MARGNLFNIDYVSSQRSNVSHSTDPKLILKATTSNQPSSGRVLFYEGTDDLYGSQLGYDGNRNEFFLRNINNGAPIDSIRIPRTTGHLCVANRIGIGQGITLPTVQLTVSGQSKIIDNTGPVLDVIRHMGSTTGVYESLVAGRTTSSGTPGDGFGTGLYFKLEGAGGDYSYAGLVGSKWVDATPASSMALVFSAVSSGIDPVDQSPRNLTIRSDGNIGILNDTPSYTLDVNGGIYSTYTSSQVIYGDDFVGNIQYPYDRILYKDGNTYYVKDCRTGRTHSSHTDFSTALNNGLTNRTTIFIPSGEYVVSSTIYFKASSSIIGSGKQTKFLLNDNTSIGFEFSSVRNCDFRNASIEVQASTYSGDLVRLAGYGAAGATGHKCANINVDNLYLNSRFWGMDTIAMHWYVTGASNKNNIVQCKFSNSYIKRGKYGMKIHADSPQGGAYINSNWVTKLFMTGCSSMIYMSGVATGSDSTLQRNTFRDIKAQAITTDDDRPLTVRGVYVIGGLGNVFDDIIIWDWSDKDGRQFKFYNGPTSKDTYVNFSEACESWCDSGTRTWGFRRGGSEDGGSFYLGNVNISSARDLYVTEDLYVGSDIYHIQGGGNTRLRFFDDKIQYNVNNLGTYQAYKNGSHVDNLFNYNANAWVNFIVSGDTIPLIFADAGTEKIGIRKNSPSYDIDVNGTIYTNDSISSQKFIHLNPHQNVPDPTAGTLWASSNAAGTYCPLYYCSSNTGKWKLVTLT